MALPKSKVLDMPVRHLNQSPDLEAFAYIRPCIGERVSGDTAVIASRDGHGMCAVIDALGHGPAAHQVAVAAERYLIDNWVPDPLAMLQGLSDVLSGGLGAAAGIAVIEFGCYRVKYAGVGNTTLRVFNGKPRRLLSVEGVLGQKFRAPHCQELTLLPDEMLVMYTDGVSDKMELRSSELRARRSCGHVARSLVERFGKDHDDATCLVARRIK